MDLVVKVRAANARLAAVKAMLCAAVVAGFAAMSVPALAQVDECAKLGQTLMKRGKLIEQVQRFEKKRPTADEACAVFTKLSEATQASITEVEKNGTWCHVPPDALPGLRSQEESISKTRKDACGAAVQQKKQMEEAKKNNLLGGGDILGGPIKVPKGAL